ncbi:MAG: glycoside hydrolase family 140 protein [Thermoguttaceae bacterium]
MKRISQTPLILLFLMTAALLSSAQVFGADESAAPQQSRKAFEAAKEKFAKELDQKMADAVAELAKESNYQRALIDNPSWAKLQRMAKVGSVHSSMLETGLDLTKLTPLNDQFDAKREIMELSAAIKKKYVDDPDAKLGLGDLKLQTPRDNPLGSREALVRAGGSQQGREAFEAAKEKFANELDQKTADAVAELAKEPNYQRALINNPSLAKLQRLAKVDSVHSSMIATGLDLTKLTPLNDRIDAQREITELSAAIRKKYIDDPDAKPGLEDLELQTPRDNLPGIQDVLARAGVSKPEDAPVKAKPLRNLKVSDNRRYLVTEDGEYFFWLGDTAWELFHRTTKEEARRYLDSRAKLGFNVIQAVAVAEFSGLDVPNRYGFLPFVDPKTPTPAVKNGPDNDYWDYVDFVVDEANKRGMYIGFLPTWGSWWKEKGGILTPENAGQYGEWLGKRYKDKKLVWILGGDRAIDTDRERATIEALAKGIRRGDGGTHLITFHPTGGGGSSEYFHDADWLDFNMRQNGHNNVYASYEGTARDYERKPIKPVVDGEPIYEGHPVSFDVKRNGYSLAIDVRHAFYWDALNGAAGFTYGHHSIWQFYDSEVEGRAPVNGPLCTWQEALEAPGAAHMQYGKFLMESRPQETRIPDPMLIFDDRFASTTGTRHYCAARDVEGTYAFIYVPEERPVTVNTSLINSKKLNVYWFNPRGGWCLQAGTVENLGKQTFVPPSIGELIDWVLVLDDPLRNYPVPAVVATIQFVDSSSEDETSERPPIRDLRPFGRVR